MSGGSELINFLFNVLICGSFASFLVSTKNKDCCLEKKKQQSKVEQYLI